MYTCVVPAVAVKLISMLLPYVGFRCEVGSRVSCGRLPSWLDSFEFVQCDRVASALCI